MTLFIPGRCVRLLFFTVAAGGAGFHSAETTAITLCCLVILAACCREPVRLDLVFIGMAAFAARYSQGDFAKFKASLMAVAPFVIALGALYFVSNAVFGPRGHSYGYGSWRRFRGWRN